MGFKSDIEIAQETQMAVINEIAEKLEIHDEFVDCLLYTSSKGKSNKAGGLFMKILSICRIL